MCQPKGSTQTDKWDAAKPWLRCVREICKSFCDEVGWLFATHMHLYMHTDPDGSFTFNYEQTWCERAKVGSPLASKRTETTITPFFSPILTVSSLSSDVFSIRYISAGLMCARWNVLSDTLNTFIWDILFLFPNISWFAGMSVCINVCHVCEFYRFGELCKSGSDYNVSALEWYRLLSINRSISLAQHLITSYKKIFGRNLKQLNLCRPHNQTF